MMLWGVDMGGTKIECVVIDSDTRIRFRDRVPTNADQGYEHILLQFKKIVDLSISEVGTRPDYIGVCTPGSIDRSTGLLRNSNTVALNNKPFLEDLSAVIDTLVMMENDANCFALAEHHMGSVRGLDVQVDTTFGVIMGTGVGGGIVHHDKLLTGYNGIAGEWGHNYLDASGGPCYCGKVGCVETIISGPALENFYDTLSNQNKSLKEIYSDHLSGTDNYATETMNRLIRFFGIGLSQVINILDPDVIVIGGGVGNIDLLYTAGLSEVMKNIFSPTAKCRIIKPKLGDSAGVFGAAFLKPN